jgi:hypothetical protein
MTSMPALDWLDDEFTGLWATGQFADKDAPGPLAINPMIDLRSVMDAGAPMAVTQADYKDPDRWWL